MDQQRQAFLIHVSQQLETVLAACEQNGSAEVLIGSKRHPNRLVQVKLVAEQQTISDETTSTCADANLLTSAS